MGDYQPSNCVECGADTPNEVAIPVTLELDNGTTAIPGLYRCFSCQFLLDGGIISSNINEEEAFDYLAGRYIPSGTISLMLGIPPVPDELKPILAERLSDAIDIANELVRRLGGEGSDTPEAEDGRTDWDRALESIHMDDNGQTTYECPSCGKRHPVDWLFQMVEEQGNPGQQAA